MLHYPLTPPTLGLQTRPLAPPASPAATPPAAAPARTLPPAPQQLPRKHDQRLRQASHARMQGGCMCSAMQAASGGGVCWSGCLWMTL